MAHQVRRGTDAERQTVTFLDGEPVWCTDTRHFWMGDGATLGGIPIGAVHAEDTVAEGELTFGTTKLVLYCYETQTFYRYLALGAAYTRDGLFILNTAAGGDTRWIGIAGQYIHSDSKQIRGLLTRGTSGADIMVNGNFATLDFTGWIAGANWSAATGAAVHTPGSTATLVQNPAGINIGDIVWLQFSILTNTNGTINVSVGGVAIPDPFPNAATSVSYAITATAAAGVTITPSNDFDGSLDNFTLRILTTSDPVLEIRNDDGTLAYEFRANDRDDELGIGTNALTLAGAGDNIAIGDNAMRYGYIAQRIVAIGTQAAQHASSANSNTSVVIGHWGAREAGTIGTSVCIGDGVARDVNTILSSTLVGHEAGLQARRLINCTFVGLSAGYGVRNCSQSTLVGRSAGYQSGDRCVMIGYYAGFTETEDDVLAIHNSNSSTPLLRGKFDSRLLTINGELETHSDTIRVYNDTGGTLNQYQIVRALSYDAGINTVEVSPITSYSNQTPIGIIQANLATATRGKVLVRGLLTVTGFDTSLSSLGTPVYCTNAGAVTLTKTEFPVGTVVTLAANGMVYFDFQSMQHNPLRIFVDVAAANAASGQDNDLCFVVSTWTFYRYEAVSGGLSTDNMQILDTADGGTTRWIGVSGRYDLYKSIPKFTTVAQAEAFDNKGQGDLIYVSDTDTIYRYDAVAGSFTDNNTSVLSTADGGTTRWLGVSGRYRIGDIYHQGTNTEATIGAEMLINRDFATLDFTGWTAGAGWDASTGAAVCTGPGAGTLVQSPAGLTAGLWYNVEFDIWAYTTGTLTVTMGGQTIANALDGQITGYAILIQASTTAALTFTPDATFDGTIDNVSVRQITFSTPVRTVYQDNGTVAHEERTGGLGRYGIFLGENAGRACDASSNLGIGWNSLASMSQGTSNLGFGSGTLQKLAHRNSTSNLAFGTIALQNLQAGSMNVCIGANALRLKIGGSYNMALGGNAGYENKYGSYNTFIGTSAGYTNTGSNNICIGSNAGYWSGAQNNRLYIDITGTTAPLIGGDFVQRWVKIDGKFFAKSVNLTVYNNTGGQLNQYRVLVTSGYYGTGQVPEANYLSSLTQRPLGVAVNNIADTTEGDVLRTGSIYVAGFSTLAATVGDKVYSDSSGNLTLTPSSIEIGVVLNIAANAYIFVNIGGGATATSSSATSVKVKRLGAEDIDGTINAVDTPIPLYVVPGGTWTIQAKVTITNRNGSIANVRLAHIDGAIGALSIEDHILYDCPILPTETKTVLIPGLLAAQTIMVRSDTVDVTFKVHGEELAAASGVYRLGAYDVVAASTNEAAYLAVANYTNVVYYICNRNNATAITVDAACIDSNLIGNWVAEDYELYQETITALETKGYDLGVGLLNAETLGINSSATGVNVIIYGEEYV